MGILLQGKSVSVASRNTLHCMYASEKRDLCIPPEGPFLYFTLSILSLSLSLSPFPTFHTSHTLLSPSPPRLTA